MQINKFVLVQPQQTDVAAKNSIDKKKKKI